MISKTFPKHLCSGNHIIKEIVTKEIIFCIGKISFSGPGYVPDQELSYTTTTNIFLKSKSINSVTLNSHISDFKYTLGYKESSIWNFLSLGEELRLREGE